MIKLDVKILSDIEKALKAKLPKIKVGISGEDTNRVSTNSQKSASSNADVGIVHEFGDENHEQRSFLRMPLEEKMEEYLEKSKLDDMELVKKLAQKKSLSEIANLIGAVGKRVVLDAFKTGGFGSWKESNMDNKKNHQTLVETQQLRDSISYVVKE